MINKQINKLPEKENKKKKQFFILTCSICILHQPKEVYGSDHKPD